MEIEKPLRWKAYKVAVGARGGGTMEVPGFMKRAAHTEEAYQLGTERHDAQEAPASRAGDPRGGGGLRLYINDHHRIALRAQERFEESMETARLLVDGCAVLLNLEHAREEEAVRILDLLSGVAYASGGEVRQVDERAYLLMPGGATVVDA